MQMGIPPLCMTKQKCPIEDIQAAPDSKELNKLVDSFFLIESLASSQGYSGVQERLMRESGLIDIDPGVLVEMKTALIKHNNKKYKLEK